MSVTALRPRSTTEIVDAALHLLRLNYVQLVTATAAIFLPAIIVALVLPESLAPAAPMLYGLLQSIATGTVVLLVSDSYLGRPPSVAGALRWVAAHGGTLIVASVLQGLLVIAGFVLLIVPGFIFMAWFFAAPIAVVLEDAGAIHALKRSRELARGHTGHVLGVLLLVLALYLVLTFLIYFVASVIGAFVPGSLASPALVEIAAGVLRILLAPIVAVVMTLLYYDLRIRKEGFDLEMMAAELDAPAGAPGRLSQMPG